MMKGKSFCSVYKVEFYFSLKLHIKEKIHIENNSQRLKSPHHIFIGKDIFLNYIYKVCPNRSLCMD